MFVTIKNSDIENFFVYPKKHMIIAGCWPITSTGKWSKIYELYAILITYPISALTSLSIFINLFLNLNTIERATDAFYVFVSNFNFILKFTCFILKKRRFEKLLKSMDNPVFNTFHEKHDALINNWKKSALAYNKFFFNSIYVCLLLFAGFPFLDKNGNVLPIGSWIPFDIENSSRNYAYAYSFQIVGLLFTAALGISIDLLPCIFMNIGCAQIEILKDNLKHAIVNAEERVRFKKDKLFIFEFNDDDQIDDGIYEPLTQEVEKELHQILKQCVRHHDAINILFREIEKVFNPGMLFLFIFNGIAICVTFLQLLMVPLKSFKYLTIIQYLIAIITQISLYCWNGHHVIVQSTTIGDSCYDMEWFRCSTKMKKEIRIIMERCKRPVKLSAGGIFELSVTSLTQILRTSYQYFNVLRTVYTK